MKKEAVSSDTAFNRMGVEISTRVVAFALGAH